MDDTAGGKSTSLVLPAVLCTIGIALLASLAVMDWVSTQEAVATISKMTDSYSEDDDPELAMLRASAHAYNARMVGGDSAAEPGTEIMPYAEQMSFRGLDQIAWLSIPKIDVAMPIYHGTGNAVLAGGAGHMEDTALPVGGESTHCVLTGHSGMSDNRMFDDIRLLEPGDVFILHSLGEPYAYQVESSDVVWPWETSGLKPVAGQDLCTLVTCTPYGINDHRLLVHGKRVEYESWMEPDNPPQISAINVRNMPLLGGIAVLTIAVTAFIAAGRKRHDMVVGSGGSRSDGIEISRPRRSRGWAFSALPAACCVLSVLCLGSAAWDMVQTAANLDRVQEIVEAGESLSESDRSKMMEQADSYNRDLWSSLGEAGVLPYSSQLDVSGDGAIGVIEIPSLKEKIPVYHEGSGSDGFAQHLESTALPVGGNSTHSVISMPSSLSPAKLVERLRGLAQGDVVSVEVLGEKAQYKFSSQEDVAATDVSSLDIRNNQDQLTLAFSSLSSPDMVTLVHMDRQNYNPQAEVDDVEMFVNYRTAPFLISGVLLAAAGIGITAFRSARGGRR